jgi:hypothetical protein
MRNWHQVLQVAFVALSVLAITCSGTERECDYPPLVPLAVGNSWAYVVCRIDSGGGEPNCWSQDTIRVTRLGELDGESYYVTDHVMAFCETPDGLSMVGWRGLRVSEYDYFLRYPVADGTLYDYSSTKVDQHLMFVRVREEAVTVPAGRYRVFTYELYFGSSVPFATLSFAPGVGLVKFTFPSVGHLQMLVSADLARTVTRVVGETNGVCGP